MTDKYFLSLNENPSEVTFIFDLQSLEFNFIDPEFADLLDLNPTGLTKGQIFDRLFPEDRAYLEKYYLELLNGKYRPCIEFRFKMGKEVKWIRLTPIKLKSEAGNMIAGNAEEITGEVHNAWTLEKYANKKDSVLSILAYDLRNPLSIVKNMSIALGKELDNPHLSGPLQTITKVVQQSIDLINDLLAREFLESTEVELVKKRIDIAAKLKDYMEEYQNSKWVSERSFKFNSSHQHIFLELDEVKFIQIINNLMSNSLKFTKSDGEISVDIKLQPHTVLFTFTDDGIGIPQKYQDDIFKKFTDSRRNGLNGEPAAGLGLYMVKTIIEWHKGKIWFESEECKGTKFFIEIDRIDI